MRHPIAGKTQGVRWALMIAASQIIGGSAKCAYCDQEATLFIANGADPDDEPCCSEHGLDFLRSQLRMAESLFGPKREVVPA